MKQYSLLIGLATVFLYSMDEDIEIIQFETPLMEEKKYESFNEENERTYFYHDQKINQYYRYDSTIHHTQGCIKDVAWHPTETNKLLTITDETVCLWNTQKNEKPIITVSSEINTRGFNCLSLSNDGSRAVCGGSNILFVWDFLKNETLKTVVVGPYYDFLQSQAVTKALFIPKHTDIVVTIFRGNEYHPAPHKNVITLKNITNKQTDIIKMRECCFNDMAMHPLNENILIVAQKCNKFDDTSFAIFDIAKKKLKHTIKSDVYRITCDPSNESMIATGGWWDPSVNLWDLRIKGLKAGNLKTAKLSLFQKSCVDLHWLPHSNSIVVSSEKGTQLFDIRTGSCIEDLPNAYRFFHAINCCAPETGQHTESMKGMRVHAQDQTLATFSKNSIKLWNNTK